MTARQKTRFIIPAVITAAVLGIGGIALVRTVGRDADVKNDFPMIETLEDGTQEIRTAQDGRMTKHTVKNAAERQAVCNDGSPATYYFREGTGENADKWVIHLKGGGACVTPKDCLERWENQRGLMTSNSDPNYLAGGGIHSADETKNPDFYNFNQVRINYCSSDYWSGDQHWESDSGVALEFRGHNIITAVLEDLQDDSLFPSQNLGDATRVMFAGGSAGAVGAMSNLDRVADMLSFAEVWGVDDSAWSMVGAYPAYGQSEIAEERTTDFLAEFQNPQVDESCRAANMDKPSSYCMSSRVVADYLKTPFFLYIDQFDHFVLAGMAVTDRRDPDQAEYLVGMHEAMRETFADLDGVLSSRTGRHTGLNNDGYYKVTVDGLTYRELLTNWYFGLDGPTRAIAGD